MHTGTRDYVTIVSGLPRSGTSMMMMILEAGGIPALTDGVRQADPDNPRGYYEFEAVKKTRDDPSWLEHANGKVVKMVYRLLYDLPQNRAYRVVFMRRNLDEILASQAKMLQRKCGRAPVAEENERMAGLFHSALAEARGWLANMDCFDALYVDHGEVIRRPRKQMARINEFLGGDLDEEAMASVVDPSLYRQRAGSSGAGPSPAHTAASSPEHRKDPPPGPAAAEPRST